MWLFTKLWIVQQVKACGKYAIKIVGVYIMHTMLCVYNSAHARGPLLSTVNGSDRSRAKQNLNGSSGGWIHAAAGLNSLMCNNTQPLHPRRSCFKFKSSTKTSPSGLLPGSVAACSDRAIACKRAGGPGCCGGGDWLLLLWWLRRYVSNDKT